MIDATPRAILNDRRRLMNPYAHIAPWGQFSALSPRDQGQCSSAQLVPKSRALLQDPYAHLDGDGGYTAEPRDGYDMNPAQLSEAIGSVAKEHKRKETPHTLNAIEEAATGVLRSLWKYRSQLYVSDPIELLDPELVFRFLGFNFEVEESLGQYVIDGKRVEIAGVIDDSEKSVRISRRFPRETMKFTAAHELGHAVLHHAPGLHRDRPVDGINSSRNRNEYEADKFATFFLMPKKFLIRQFGMRFLTDSFVLDEGTKFALSRGNASSVDQIQSLRELSRCLATAQNYNGARFTSLANHFGVSPEAMAIRIEELGLVTS